MNNEQRPCPGWDRVYHFSHAWGQGLPSSFVGKLCALLAEPVFSNHGASLLQLIPLLSVALDDICHAVTAERHHIAQLLAPPCLHIGTATQ